MVQFYVEINENWWIMAEKEKRKYDVIIIGAGASGMMAAITAGRRGRKVLLLEKMARPGKKLLATGNGKCNFTNANLSEGCYYGDQNLVREVLGQFSLEQCLHFFHEIGVYPKNKNGYYYPNSGQAQSVVCLLEEELKRTGADVKTHTELVSVRKEKHCFLCECKDGVYTGSNLVFATGLLASPKLGSDGTAFPFIRSFGHHMEPVLPALCGFYGKGLRFQKISGVRCDAHLSLEISGKQVNSERGELQLTDYGVSGIPVFQLSSPASRALHEKKECRLHMDFLPDFTYEELMQEIRCRVQRAVYPTTSEFLLLGLLPEKLAIELLYRSGLWNVELKSPYKEKVIKSLVGQIKHTVVSLERIREAEFAQVCTGGIKSDEINSHTLESRLCPGLFFTGELLNVDGICGGYNLHFAWGSGYLVGNQI